MEYSGGNFTDPDYIMARISCGYGVLPDRWKMPEKLKKAQFNPEVIFIPNDRRLNFLKQQIGFTDLAKYRFDQEKMQGFLPMLCRIRLNGKKIPIRQLE